MLAFIETVLIPNKPPGPVKLTMDCYSAHAHYLVTKKLQDAGFIIEWTLKNYTHYTSLPDMRGGPMQVISFNNLKKRNFEKKK
jgi:hypothetical protein